MTATNDDASPASSAFDDFELRPGQEPLTPEEKERFLARVRGEGRTLTSDEMYALFGPPPEPATAAPDYGVVEEMAVPTIDADGLARLERNFFYDVDGAPRAGPPLVRGIIFDFGDTIASLTRPLDELWPRVHAPPTRTCAPLAWICLKISTPTLSKPGAFLKKNPRRKRKNISPTTP